MKDTVHTLLVPVDFSDVTANVLEEAQTLALAFKSRIVLLHISEPEPDFVGFEPGPVSVRSSVAKEFHTEHKHLEEAKQQLVKAGIEVVALHIQGPTIEKIIQESAQQNADIIVLGSHGHGALHNLLTGSVAAGVLKSAKRPVLIVPAAARA
jgi:nucleotide-binding universal stress UspA family protein